jgi:hypothetical protein
MRRLSTFAPSVDVVTEYDRRHLSLYAVLLDAEHVGVGWREIVSGLMQLDPDGTEAESCWRSHLERARWITGAGLAQAIETFGQRADLTDS